MKDKAEKKLKKLGTFGIGFMMNAYNQVTNRGGPISEVIDDFLWLGNLYGASNESMLTDLGVTHILSVTQFGDHAVFHEDKFVYKVVQIEDEPDKEIIHFFEVTNEFIQQCFEGNGKIFVHCNQGRSRSATIVLAYLIFKFRMSYEEALEFLQSRRDVASPNEGFQNQLMAYHQYILQKDTDMIMGYDENVE